MLKLVFCQHHPIPFNHVCLGGPLEDPMEKDGKREKGNTHVHVHKHVQIVDGKEQVHDTVLRFLFFFGLE